MTRFGICCGGSLVALAVFLVAVNSKSAATNNPDLRESDRLVVHEWGTFTSLQDENGKQIGGINVDDEPVPSFVHNLSPHVLGPQHAMRPLFLSKGVPQRHPLVTMRLETPVIYFYPPKSHSGPLSLDVDVQFRGGWLTQFYPQAKVDAPGMKNGRFDYAAIDANTVGRLTWTDLKIGAPGNTPQTDDAVWLAPRNVRASVVTSPEGESEKYLFYRGVGNINSPLRVMTDTVSGNLAIGAYPDKAFPSGHSIKNFWLVQIQPDGSTAFRSSGLTQVGAAGSSDPSIKIQSKFESSDYTRENLNKLQGEMHAALVADGLFDEEATAMLKTWEKSYFRSGGLRLFYLVPHAWIDHYLPLQISRDAEVDRVMVARTELISPEQRALLQKLSTGPASNSSWLSKLSDSPSVRKFREGRSDFGELGVPIPDDYQTYLKLGRFRNALLLWEQARQSTPALDQFITSYGLERFRPPAKKSE